MNLSLPQVQAYMTSTDARGATSGPPPAAAGPNPKLSPGLPPTLPQPAPPIYYSESPAILVIFEGKPGFAPVVSGSKLFFSVNTNWAVFQDKNSGTYYLQDQASWLQAQDVNGPWQPAGQLPASLSNLPAQRRVGRRHEEHSGHVLGAGHGAAGLREPEAGRADPARRAGRAAAGFRARRYPGSPTPRATSSSTRPRRTWYYLVSGRWFSARAA